ncbi:MAG: UdgX family uracil-DNA binding protein [Pirellulales bacterium]
MPTIVVLNFDDWRQSARHLLAHGTPPADVHFIPRSAQRSLFDAPAEDNTSCVDQSNEPIAVDRHHSSRASVPQDFLELAREAACHRAETRFDLLYRVLWRLTHGERRLLEVETDDDIHRLRMMEKAVRRDAHKMKAFVRFRRIMNDGEEQFIAWHRPDHHTVELVAPFFARRFPSMNWSILTPCGSVHWNGRELAFGPGLPSTEAPRGDELEDLWRTYYGPIFNPARIKLKTMTREMPVRHWRTLPETSIIPDLLTAAPQRVAEMLERSPEARRSAADYVPLARDLDSLRAAAATCQGCNLYCHATQTVFGEGPSTARLVLVGEQPGDVEDQQGRAFVGPAGEVLAEAMLQVGLTRDDVYLTNAVKHFKFVLRGKRRIHNKPSIQEAIACRPWLVAEIGVIKPAVLVCLGATAAQSLMGADFRITRDRGVFRTTTWCRSSLATFHPSAVLRAPDAARRDQLYSELVRDLAAAVERLQHLSC